MNDIAKKLVSEAIETHKKMVAEMEIEALETIAAAAKAISTALKQNHRVYICGNGGSAADAQHIAGELIGRFKRQRKALAVVALTTDTSVLTALANDYAYDNVFARQVEALVEKGDILWALSTSGTSANVIKASQLAKKKGAFILAFTGRAESRLERLADICLCAESDSTARSQEIHQLAYHIICDLVEQSFCK